MRLIPVALSFALAVAALPLAAETAAKPLTVETIFAHGSLTGHAPSELTWSPDGKHLTYLENGALMEIALATGKPQVLVDSEKLAALTGGGDTEKDRDHRARYKMASYVWAPDARHLLFDSEGRLWLYDLANSTGIEVGSAGAASGGDPKFAPDGKSISFVREHGLTVIDLRLPGTKPIPVAPSRDKTILNGEVDWVYSEELDVRSNYFWSPDSRTLAFLEMNEANVPVYPIEDWIPTHATVDEQRYPQPGDPNPAVRVGVVSAHGGKTVWVKLPMKAGDDYIPRFGWVDGKHLWIETVTRDQKHFNIYLAGAATGEAHPLLQLTDPKFFDDHYDVWVDAGQIVLTNWADGHNHIYLYHYGDAGAATLTKQLTSGNFDVGDVYNVNFQTKTIEYASNEGQVQDQQLWRVDFDGRRQALTTTPGFHAGNFSPTGNAYVDRLSSRMETPQVRLCQTSGCAVFWKANTLAEYGLKAPVAVEAKAADGSTLYGTLLLPAGATAAASVPLIVNPYGGPGGQTAANRWSDSLLFDELLAEHGFAVLHADNRGSGGRGRDFMQACYHDFGPVQLADQLTVIDAALAAYPQLDRKRLGWWGWSWGGTFTLYAMSHSERFRAGVAVAPVTGWRNYDSVYTERYMSLPNEFAQGYTDFSVVNSADKLKGRLLLVHGTGDDNVHMQNSVQYIQKLIEAQKPYDLQIYPRKTHSIAGPDVKTHLYNRILAHFETYLKSAAE
ncbi:MAG: alpha/beta fold hydrolase [Terracidiphilus sp.]|nr:alpha/beta fold hydrolase [Terracidiphilus sp.]